MDSAEDLRSVRGLVYQECGRVCQESERGWTARLTVDDEVVVYWECDEREFGVNLLDAGG